LFDKILGFLINIYKKSTDAHWWVLSSSVCVAGCIFQVLTMLKSLVNELNSGVIMFNPVFFRVSGIMVLSWFGGYCLHILAHNMIKIKEGI